MSTLQEHEYDGAVLDGGLPREVATEFKRYWDLLGLGTPLIVVESAPELFDRRPVARRAADILDALRARRTFRLTVAECVFQWNAVRVALTGSEACVLSASALQEAALGYGSAVRTHVSRLRRKCRAIGLAEPIVTRDRRYRAPGVRLSQPDD